MKNKIIHIFQKIFSSALYGMIIYLSFAFILLVFHFFDKGISVFKYPEKLLMVFGIPFIITLVCKFVLYKLKKAVGENK
jgi:peptidoglycan/LPS O-acetylase OafA/YrhL